MADQTAPAPTDAPPAVQPAEFLADRERFSESVVSATSIAVAVIIGLLILMAIFLT
jgi:hypothetical protein